MKAHIQFTRAPIVPPVVPSGLLEIGARVEFQGIVRGLENGLPIAGLFYEAYEPMATAMLEKIIAGLNAAHPCEKVWLIHRLDFVPVGDASLFILVLARHRQAALQMTADLIDRLKTDVPVWKRP